jgi:hypothetical protein
MEKVFAERTLLCNVLTPSPSPPCKKTGRIIPERRPIMATTTINSTKVKPLCFTRIIPGAEWAQPKQI